MNKNAKEIEQMYNEVRQEIRDFISRILMDTNEDNKMECNLILDSPEDCGISDLYKPIIKFIWQVPTSGEICVEFDDDTQADLDELSLDWQIQIVKAYS